jgi:hypothetical protein
MTHTPLDVAREADRMSRNNGMAEFQRLALWCMAITALASVVQTVGHTLRDVVRERRREQGREWSR